MNISNKLTSVVEGILQIFYPPVCIICNNIIHNILDIKVICPECLADLKPISKEYIQKEIINRLKNCSLDDLFVYFQFDEVFQKIIYQIKYGKMNKLAFHIANYAATTCLDVSFLEKNTLIIPVPLFPQREKERGYNQSSYVAKGLFKGKIYEGLLERIKNTRSQTTLNRKERRENVQNAFIFKKNVSLNEKSILLIDDVVTTGATMNECAKVLKENGALNVIGIALAAPIE
jgi:competence protein ComFC